MLSRILFLLCLIQAVSAVLDTAQCGQSKGCLFAPQGCNTAPGGCQMILSYTRDNDAVVMELQGKSQAGGYMAVGFSRDSSMGDDSVSVCYDIQQRLAFTQGKSNQFVDAPGAQTLQNYESANGETYCRLRRAIAVNGNDRIYDLSNETFVVFLAMGQMNGENIGYHNLDKWILPRTEMTAFSSTSGFSPNPNLVQMEQNAENAPRSNEDQLRIAHGICMSIGWMIFLSTGILFARFFRDHMPNTTPCGVKMWFHGHRIFQTIGVALTICGFVCIFVANDWRWTGPRAFAPKEQNQTWNSIHSILGLLACVVAWAQPLNAVFRCHPGQKGRFIFNWIHRFFGFGAWLMAAAAIMIACVHFELMFSSQKSALGLFIAFVGAFGLCLIILQILQFVGWVKQRKIVGADMEMVRIDGTTRVVPSSSNSGIRKLQSLLFIPYVVVAWGTCIAICVLIGLKLKI